MLNWIMRIAVLAVLISAVMLLAGRKGKIDLSVALLLFLTAVNFTSFLGFHDNRVIVLLIITVYFLLYAGTKQILRKREEKKK